MEGQVMTSKNYITPKEGDQVVVRHGVFGGRVTSHTVTKTTKTRFTLDDNTVYLTSHLPELVELGSAGKSSMIGYRKYVYDAQSPEGLKIRLLFEAGEAAIEISRVIEDYSGEFLDLDLEPIKSALNRLETAQQEAKRL